MRELTDEEVDELYERRGLELVDAGEKWFTFEHSGPWREVERQFMGAVRSHGTPCPSRSLGIKLIPDTQIRTS